MKSSRKVRRTRPGQTPGYVNRLNDPRRHFGVESSAIAPPIDAIIMASVRDALRPVTSTLLGACWQRGLLPPSLSSALDMARFLSFVLPAARAAQSETGVPASILVADAYHISFGLFEDIVPGIARKRESNDIFETGQRFESLELALLDRAYSLGNRPDFGEVMRAAATGSSYLVALEKCELWGEPDRGDRINTITTHHLQECDLLPLTCESMALRRVTAPRGVKR